MKILIVNSYDIYGGAARAAYRLHKSLQQFGIDSAMLVQKKLSTDDSVMTCKHDRSLETSYCDKLPLQKYPNKTQTLFSTAVVSNPAVVDFINAYDADMIHLHWIANGFLSINDIRNIKKPIVWSLHDMWAFTGGCHYDEECGAYKKECGTCKILQSTSNKDLSHSIWQIKKRIFQSCQNLTIVALSSWLANCAKESSLFQHKNIVQLPNTIDTDFFLNEDKIAARDFFNLPKDKKLILFGAMGGTADSRKGYKELTLALEFFNAQNVELVVFGGSKENQQLQYKTHFVGHIQNDTLLRKLYSAVDVMIVPSLQENLSNAIMESLSCSTPVVAFNIGGNSDMIEHKINGYLAKPFEIEDLAFGVHWILFNEAYKELCNNGRNRIVNLFSYNSVVPQYIKAYETILNTYQPHLLEDSNHDQSDILSQNIIAIHSKKAQVINFSQQFNKLFQKIQALTQKNDAYILYGYGTIGKTIKALIPDKIIGHVDINDKDHLPSTLKTIQYDKIIITVLGREEEVLKYLQKDLGINKNKIITLEMS